MYRKRRKKSAASWHPAIVCRPTKYVNGVYLRLRWAGTPNLSVASFLYDLARRRSVMLLGAQTRSSCPLLIEDLKVFRSSNSLILSPIDWGLEGMNPVGAGAKGCSAARASTTRKSTGVNVRRSFEGTLGYLVHTKWSVSKVHLRTALYCTEVRRKVSWKTTPQAVSVTEALFFRYFHGGQRSIDNKYLDPHATTQIPLETPCSHRVAREPKQFCPWVCWRGCTIWQTI